MEMIYRMFGDTLWIYTAIAGALLGAAFLKYFRNTKAGIWSYSKFDQLLDFLVHRWGWTWFEQPEDVWKKQYPKIAKYIEGLESRILELENATTTKSKSGKKGN